MRVVFWHASAWDSYIEIQQQKAELKRVNTLIKDIQRNGFQCSYGKPEMLKGRLQGYASIRVDKKNRLVFGVDDEKVTIIDCGTHITTTR